MSNVTGGVCLLIISFYITNYTVDLNYCTYGKYMEGQITGESHTFKCQPNTVPPMTILHISQSPRLYSVYNPFLPVHCYCTRIHNIQNELP